MTKRKSLKIVIRLKCATPACPQAGKNVQHEKQKAGSKKNLSLFINAIFLFALHRKKSVVNRLNPVQLYEQ
jgi:hypothetical protein